MKDTKKRGDKNYAPKKVYKFDMNHFSIARVVFGLFVKKHFQKIKFSTKNTSCEAINE